MNADAVEKLSRCKCGGEAKVHGTPGYYVVRCLSCCKDHGTFDQRTKAGRARAVKLWNRINANSACEAAKGA